MTDPEKQLKQFKLIVTAVLITFLAVTTSFAFLLKTNHQELLSKDLKISALIDEVGDLKQQSEDLYQSFGKSDSKLKSISSAINDLNGSVRNGLIEKQQALDKIEAIRKDLQDTVKEKEFAIADLAQKNSLLKEEIVASKYNQDIIDILVIGQNMGLTDAMLLVSVNPQTKNISVISVPRDLYHKGRKINELFNLYGIDKLKEALYQVTGITVDKYVIFDFSSFVSIIDNFGGVDINVEKDLIDNQYPGPDNTYRKITFLKGFYHMDGDTALKYVRSRKSTTDFDRSYRQQQVLLSLHQVLRNLDPVKNLDKVMGVYDAVKDNLKTDIGIFEALGYYDNYKDYAIKSGNVISNRNFLYNSISSKGQYILLPIKGSYAKLKDYVSNLVNS